MRNARQQSPCQPAAPPEQKRRQHRGHVIEVLKHIVPVHLRRRCGMMQQADQQSAADHARDAEPLVMSSRWLSFRHQNPVTPLVYPPATSPVRPRGYAIAR